MISLGSVDGLGCNEGGGVGSCNCILRFIGGINSILSLSNAATSIIFCWVRGEAGVIDADQLGMNWLKNVLSVQ